MVDGPTMGKGITAGQSTETLSSNLPIECGRGKDRHKSTDGVGNDAGDVGRLKTTKP